MPTVLYIDADACPVKEEVYRVARRYGLKTYVVSNTWMQVPREPLIEQVVVDAGPDIADDWTVPQNWQRFTDAEHGVWRTLYRRLMDVLPGRACDEFLSGLGKREGRALIISTSAGVDKRRLRHR